jgi:hypothetical protein
VPNADRLMLDEIRPACRPSSDSPPIDEFHHDLVNAMTDILRNHQMDHMPDADTSLHCRTIGHIGGDGEIPDDRYNGCLIAMRAILFTTGQSVNK